MDLCTSNLLVFVGLSLVPNPQLLESSLLIDHLKLYYSYLEHQAMSPLEMHLMPLAHKFHLWNIGNLRAPHIVHNFCGHCEDDMWHPVCPVEEFPVFQSLFWCANVGKIVGTQRIHKVSQSLFWCRNFRKIVGTQRMHKVSLKNKNWPTWDNTTWATGLMTTPLESLESWRDVMWQLTGWVTLGYNCYDTRVCVFVCVLLLTVTLVCVCVCVGVRVGVRWDDVFNNCNLSDDGKRISSNFNFNSTSSHSIHTSLQTFSYTSSPQSIMAVKAPLTVYAVVLVTFDHALGPTVEWSYPPSVSEGEAVSEQINRNLPFLALPDGAHLVSFILQNLHQSFDYCLSLILTFQLQFSMLFISINSK